jgi:membrane-bound serine protease (ClpP class)
MMKCVAHRSRCIVYRAAAALSLLFLALGSVLEADQSTGPTAVPAFRQANHIAILTMHGEVDLVTLRSLERRVEEARAAGADAIVLDINTPGGRLDATLDICHLLKTDAPANTVAWINPQAYSAGTIIALAAREIVVAENARFGDAAPISPFGPIPVAERAKIESPILEEVIDSAERNRYDQNLVQAFVSVGVELWLLEHRQTGERVFVDREEYRRVFGEDPPQQMTSLSPSETAPRDRRGVLPLLDRLIGDPEAETESEQPADGEEAAVQNGASTADRSLPAARDALGPDDRENYRVLRQVVSSERLLTVRPDEAMYYGLAAAKIRNDEELKQFFGAQTLTRYNESWSEKLARFLMSWPVRGVLIVIFLVCLFIELAAPGAGIFGTASLVALLLLVGAPAMMGLAQWAWILLILIGIGLILLELLVIPGVGVAGVFGLLSLMIGLIGSFVTGDLGTAEGQNQLWASVTTVITALFAAGVAIWLISRQVKSIPVLDQLILRTELTPVAAGMPTSRHFPGMESDGDESAATVHGIRRGDVGVAHTDLRPAGRGDFDGRIVDVQSPGGFIEKGAPIRVTEVGRYVIDVEEADE